MNIVYLLIYQLVVVGPTLIISLGTSQREVWPDINSEYRKYRLLVFIYSLGKTPLFVSIICMYMICIYLTIFLSIFQETPVVYQHVWVFYYQTFCIVLCLYGQITAKSFLLSKKNSHLYKGNEGGGCLYLQRIYIEEGGG